MKSCGCSVSARPTVVLNCPPAWHPGEVLPARTGRLRSRAGIDTARPLVLYQGGFSVDRGIEELVAALDTPTLAGTDVAAVFIGYGRLRGMAPRASSATPEQDRRPRRDPPNELQEFTVDADVGFVGQPPRTLNQRLNLANKLFEYLQAAVPVVVAEGTAHCRLVRQLEVGRCVDVDQPEAIARAIVAFIAAAPEDKERLRLHVRAVAMERYTWEAQGAKVVELYRRIAE